MTNAADATAAPLPPEADEARTQDGTPLAALSRTAPLLVVFLRHAGCPFCREVLADLRRNRAAIEAAGTRIVLVHLTDEESARAFFAGYGLDDVPRIADPGQRLYRAFGLRRGSAWEVMGPAAWLTGMRAVLLRGNLPGVPQGDVFQMPGAFLVHDGRILRTRRAETSGERLDLVDLATCPLPSAPSS